MKLEEIAIDEIFCETTELPDPRSRVMVMPSVEHMGYRYVLLTGLGRILASKDLGYKTIDAWVRND